MAKAGLSRMERAVLQDEGYTGIGQENGNFPVYKFRVKNKIQPTLSDMILILKHRNWIELEDYILEAHKEDLELLRSLIDETLASSEEYQNLITKICNPEEAEING